MKKTKTVNNWKELVKLVEDTNPYINTLVLSGFINELKNGRLRIKRLMFNIEDISILNTNGKDCSIPEE